MQTKKPKQPFLYLLVLFQKAKLLFLREFKCHGRARSFLQARLLAVGLRMPVLHFLS